MITGVNHITLAVSNLQRSTWFYSEILGGALRADGKRGAYLELGNLWLCLTLSDDPIQPRSDYTHIALACSNEDFQILAKRITDHARLWQDNRSEGASLYFLDPDGHKLELHSGDLNTRLTHYRARPNSPIRVYN
ncbi:VOC family protein [Aliiroseovarius sp. S253]|uniref:VOC family protein n=1 Tax=Aliiroseovarius sp. S253 TaxID=3415133 RepID=UPI003C7A678D